LALLALLPFTIFNHFCILCHFTPILASQPFALETNLDGDEDSFENLLAEQMHPKVLTDMSHRSCQNMSEMSGQQMIEKRHSSDSSSENGQHQSNVRRRLSEGLKSFSFRK
jgi:hypothetical protein